MTAAPAPITIKPCLTQFAHIKRYVDPVNRCVSAKLLPGEYYVSQIDEMITTVLGSCISACIYDPLRNIGGMNHFMLPVAGASDRQRQGTDLATRYGFFAMESLINDLLKLGCRKQNLKAKLFGGGQIIQGMTPIGQQNIRFAKEYLRTEGLPLESSDVGLIYPRKVNFFPKTGRVFVNRLQSMHNDTLIVREKTYMETLSHQDLGGDIELF